MPANALSYIEVALPVPLRQTFTYCHSTAESVQIGVRVSVPFGRRKLIGLVTKKVSIPPTGIKCKPVLAVLDDHAVVDSELLRLLLWASQYYQHPLGEVINAALPKKLREGGHFQEPESLVYQRTAIADKADLTRAPAQQKLISLIGNDDQLLADQIKSKLPTYRAPLKALLEKGLVEGIKPQQTHAARLLKSAVQLNAEQLTAIKVINKQRQEFTCTLLNGVTGSGKTEVYFSLIEKTVLSNKQSLVLFPEIALTTQILARFIKRFGESNIVSLHSGLSEKERGIAWRKASQGSVPIILGTRLAVFTHIQNLALIIVDEEHDTSFKQQEGFRYHARSLAIKRASLLAIPIVLGSATPSLESLNNVVEKRYQGVKLTKRAAIDKLPQIELIDLNHYPAEEGLTQPLLAAIKQNYSDGKQSMVFINRRGFAPVLYCNQCQWIAKCPRCDAALTQHTKNQKLNCHFCGSQLNHPGKCVSCHQETLVVLGAGTQRIEQVLTQHIPEANIRRFDRDEMASQASLEQGLESVHTNETDILVGTQLLTKGHDFKNVSLVAVVNADQGLYSHDFRAIERLAAQLIQVAGRAGRSSAGGKVIIQSRHCRNRTLLSVQAHDYAQFAQHALQERKRADFPPYSHLAIWRAQSPQQGKALYLLQQLAKLGDRSRPSGGMLFDPCKSAMEKKAGRYRAQLLVRCASRKELNSWLNQWLSEFEKTKLSRLAKWSIDVDPIDLY